MVSTFLRTILLIVTLLGGYTALRIGQENAQLRAEARRLRTLVGHMPIDDPQKIHVTALDSSDPQHFLWRVYLPPNYDVQFEEIYDTGGQSSSWSGAQPEAQNFIAQLRWRANPDGTVAMWTKWNNLSSLSSNSSPAWLESAKHPERCTVRQLGKERMAVIDPGQVIELLNIDPPASADVDEPMVTIKFGSKEAWDEHNAATKHGH